MFQQSPLPWKSNREICYRSCLASPHLKNPNSPHALPFLEDHCVPTLLSSSSSSSSSRFNDRAIFAHRWFPINSTNSQFVQFLRETILPNLFPRRTNNAFLYFPFSIASKELLHCSQERNTRIELILRWHSFEEGGERIENDYFCKHRAELYTLTLATSKRGGSSKNVMIDIYVGARGTVDTIVKPLYRTCAYCRNL